MHLSISPFVDVPLGDARVALSAHTAQTRTLQGKRLQAHVLGCDQNAVGCSRVSVDRLDRVARSRSKARQSACRVRPRDRPCVR